MIWVAGHGAATLELRIAALVRGGGGDVLRTVRFVLGGHD
jgi:hypothetical protein